MSTTPKVRMDKSRVFSTVHGERTPGDPHANVHYYQDGLPFDAHGHCLPGAIQAHETKARALYEKRLNKLIGGAKASVPAPKPAPVIPKEPEPEEPEVADTTPDPEDEDPADVGDDAGGESGGDDDVIDPADAAKDGKEVNLEAWVRGEAKYPWFAVSAAIADRYSKRVSNQADAVIFLVEEGVVTKDQVSSPLAKFL